MIPSIVFSEVSQKMKGSETTNTIQKFSVKKIFENYKSRLNSISLFLLFSTIYVSAQDSIRIAGHLQNNTRFAKVVVQKFGVGIFDIAAVIVNKDTGKFGIAIPPDIEPGIYRFRYSQTDYQDYIDVIINGKESEINFSLDLSKDSQNRVPIFTVSNENLAWHNFNQKQKKELYALQLMQDFILDYPDKHGTAYKTVKDEYEAAKIKYKERQVSFVNETPFYWAKRCAQYSEYFFPEITDHPRLQLFDFQANFWEGKPTTDPLLINTPLYVDAILNYLRFYIAPPIDFDEVEQNNGLTKSTDKIMQLFSGHEKTREFAFKYLQIGFKEIGNEKLLQYLEQNYKDVADQCLNKEERSDFEKRMEGYQTLKIGNQAPDFLMKLEDIGSKSLYNLKSNKTLLVFWASSCPHCTNELPDLQRWSLSQKDLKVVAISLDEREDEFKSAIKSYPSLIHSCDYKSWNTEAAEKYHVVATPTYFLLDKDKKILAKYSSFNQFGNKEN